MMLNKPKKPWFHRRSEDSVKKRATQIGSGRYARLFKPGIDEFKSTPGTNCIRILPQAEGADNDHYAMPVWVHDIRDTGQFVCPAKTETPLKSKRCAACDASNTARNNGDKEEAYKFSPTRRWVCWVIDRNDKTKSIVPKIYNMPGKLDDVITLASKIKGKTYIIDDPDSGFDVEFTRVGSGLNTSYPLAQIDPTDPTPVGQSQKECDRIRDWVIDHPIRDVLVYTKSEDLEKIISGMLEERDEDLDEEIEEATAPERPHRVKAKKGKPPFEEDEEESDEDEDPDDTEEQADEELEDEEVDEEEEDDEDSEADSGSDDEDDDDSESESEADEGDEEDGEADEVDDEEEEERPAKRVVAKKKKKR